MFFATRSPLKLAFPFVMLALFTACGDDDDDNLPPGDGDVVTDGGPTDEDLTDQDGDGDHDPTDQDGGDGDTDGGDGGDGDGGPTDEDPPPPEAGLDARPSQQTCLPRKASRSRVFVDRFPGIRFSGPVSMSQKPGDPSRIYVNQRNGQIYSFPNDPTAVAADKVLALNLSDVQFTGWDCSAAALVFSPNFATDHAAYVPYCYKWNRVDEEGQQLNPHIQVRLSRFTSADGGLTFDRASEQVLIAINYNETADPPEADPGYSRSCGHSANEDGLHAGNAAHFGSDGYLYWAVGDGGPQGHCGGKQAQNLSSLRGKLLRLDVSNFTIQVDPANLDFNEGWQYTDGVEVPPDNPRYGGDGTDPNPTKNIELGVIQPFIYAYGFRNPWQWSFDPADGSIWLGDVGNGTWEEVNRNVQAGGNYGWGYFEGYHCANGWNTNEYPNDGVDPVNPACTTFANQVQWPMLQVRHGESYSVTNPPVTLPEHRLPNNIYGRAISGGQVYRGTTAPTFTGGYFFGDYSTQRIWVVPNVDAISTATGVTCNSSADCGPGLVCKSHELPYENGYNPDIVGAPGVVARCTADYELVQEGVPVASFAHDLSDNFYAVMLFGAPTAVGGLSGWVGMLQDATVSGETTAPQLLSQTGCFDVDAGGIGGPVDDLIPFAPAAELWSDRAIKSRWMAIPDDAQITLASDGDFDFPPGSVLVKEFALGALKVETRFVVRDAVTGAWAAYTYAWNDEQTDATLVGSLGDYKTWGTQVWQYPSRSQCFQCHNTIAGTSLGPETAQLNHDIVYPATGRTWNQMDTLVHLGIVDPTNAPAPWANLAPLADETRTIEERARAYLHANCSVCHRPDGPTFVPADFRYSTDFVGMNICDAPPSISEMEELIEPGTGRLLAPADPDSSQVYVRMKTTLPQYRMPPLARAVPHDAALAVIEEWINSISSCEPPEEP